MAQMYDMLKWAASSHDAFVGWAAPDISDQLYMGYNYNACCKLAALKLQGVANIPSSLCQTAQS